MYNNVMVVDDSQIDLYVSQRLIEKFSFARNVILMDSPRQALEYLKTHAEDEAELPEVIFLDINMPEMNGFQFLDVFETLPNSIIDNCAITMLTTSIHILDKKKAEGNPHVQGYLIKPLSGDKLNEMRGTSPQLN